MLIKNIKVVNSFDFSVGEEMFDKIIDFAKDMKSKAWYYGLIIVSTFYLVTKSWKVVEETYIAIVQSTKMILYHSLSIGFIIAMYIGVMYIFKLSERKSQEKIDWYNKPIELEKNAEKYIYTKLREVERRFNGEYCKTLEILISNPSDIVVNYLRGVVYLCRDNTRIYKINVETYELKKTNFERIFYERIDDKMKNWDSFEVFIEEIRRDDSIEKNIMIRSSLIIRTHYIEWNLSRFYDFTICGIKTKYNLAWLKEKVKISIIPAIKFFYSRRTYYIEKQPLYLELKDLSKRLLRFTLVIIIFLLILALGILALVDICELIRDIYIIWQEYFQQITKLL